MCVLKDIVDVKLLLDKNLTGFIRWDNQHHIILILSVSDEEKVRKFSETDSIQSQMSSKTSCGKKDSTK